MTDLDWHAGRAAGIAALDLDHEGLGDETLDHVGLRAWRLGRIRAEMAKRDIAACLLFDPVNIRYASGARNMQVFSARNTPARYLLLPVEGPVLLYEFTGCAHLAEGLETIDEVRPALTASYVAAGDAIAEREKHWAREIAAALRETCEPGSRVGIERINAGAVLALAAEGFHLVDAQEPVERARAIKGPEELVCIRASILAVERATRRMRAALEPGITEQQLWSLLHQGVIAQGGDYVETRLLSSGARSNPWFQECGPKAIGRDELVSFDTDVVGCHGYYCDFSRSFHAGPGRPSGAQRALYARAHEQLHHNIGILRPGLSFREYSERAWSIPEAYLDNRYYLSAHGVGMTGEYPYLYHRMDYAAAGYDGIVEPGMTLCVEAYIGEGPGVGEGIAEGAGYGAREGVKLEQQVLVTETGTELLSHYPFEDALLGSEV